MIKEKITKIFARTSNVCAVLTAPAIVLSTAATNILFLATVVFNLAAGNWRAKFDQIIYNPGAKIFLLFYALFIVGTLYSTAPWSDVWLILRKYDKFFLAILFLPLFTEAKWRNYAINAFLAAIFVMLLMSYLKSFGWLSFGAGYGVVEIFKRSIEFNFLMAFAAYLCLIKIVTRQHYRWLWGVFFLLIVHTIFFRSTGRSGYFVFLGLMGLFFWQKLRWRGLFGVMLGALVLLGLTFSFASVFKDRISVAFNEIKTYRQDDNTSVGIRMAFVENGLQLVKAKPIFGTGTGSFAQEYTAAYPDHPSRFYRNPHNEYIHIMVQFGVLGLVVLLLLFGIPMWYSRLLPQELQYIVRGVVLGIALGCLANSWLLDTTEGHFYAYFTMLTFAALPRAKR